MARFHWAFPCGQAFLLALLALYFSSINKWPFHRSDFLLSSQIDSLVHSSDYIQMTKAPHRLFPNVSALEEYLPVEYRNGSYKVMFATSLWLEESKVYLSVVRLYRHNLDSFAIATLHSEDWEEEKTKRLIGSVLVPGVLPIAVPKTKRKVMVGPEDCRLFRRGDEFFCIFNMIDTDKKRKMWLFSFATGRSQRLQLSAYNGKIPKAEKNWTPILDENFLRVVYNHRDLQICSCPIPSSEETVTCELVQGRYNHIPGALRGGSPYIRYQDTEYFFSFAYVHVHHPKHPLLEAYRPTISILRKKSQDSFSLIHTASILNFGNPFFTPNSSVHEDGRILTPASISRVDFDKDLLTVTINVFDESCFAIQLGGVSAYLGQIIKKDKDGSLYYEDKGFAEASVRRYFLANKI